MRMVLRFYPGDHAMLLVGVTLVHVTAVIALAWLMAWRTRFHAAARDGIWLCASMGVLISPVVICGVDRSGPSWVLLFHAPASQLVPIAAQPIPASDEWTEGGRISVDSILAADSRGTTSQSSESAPTHTPRPAFAQGPLLSWSDRLRAAGVGVAALWIMGSLLFSARLMLGLMALAALRHETRPIDRNLPDKVSDEVCEAFGGALLRIGSSARVKAPLAAGVLRPMVILPEGLASSLELPQLRDVLIHECSHIARRDSLVGLLQRLAEIAYWPHPLVHLLNRELARAREEVCDNHALRQGGRAGYARTLLTLAEGTVIPAHACPSPGLWLARWKLEDRVAGILDERRGLTTRVSPWRLAMVTTVFLMTGLAIAGFRPTDTVGSRPPGITVQSDERLIGGEQPAVRDDTPLPPGARMRLGTLRLRQQDSIKKVAFSADGKYLVTDIASQEFQVWDVVAGRPIRRIRPPIKGFSDFALSPNGKVIASVGHTLNRAKRLLTHFVC